MPRFRILPQIRPIDTLIVLAIVALVGWKGMNKPAKQAVQSSEFARQVDLTPLDRIAVQADGRLRSFESHAKTFMGFVSGPRTINGQSNGFTYLDMMFQPESYVDADIIYVKNKQVRMQILTALKGHPEIDSTRADTFLKRGLISKALLNESPVRVLMERLGKDLIRTAKVVDSIQSALNVSTPRFLEGQLRVIAPPSGAIGDPWFSITDVLGAPTGAPMDAAHAGLTTARPIPGLDADARMAVQKAWVALRAAWRENNAQGVNVQLAALTGVLPGIAPELYPTAGRLGMESWYFRSKSMTWVWWIYALAVVPLLMSIIYKWDGARKFGMVMFVLAFAAHTASVGVRWYISGRWPNANMFEAVTTAAWLGGVAAIVIEWIVRKSAMRNLFALGSAVASMTALMVAYFLPAQLDSRINNKMAALNDVWLYIHTNMIIFSYALIALAAVMALLQLRHRWVTLWDAKLVPKLRMLVLPIAVGVLNYTTYLILMHVINPAHYGLERSAFIGVGGALVGSLMILVFELLEAKARVASGVRIERSAVGGAAALILGGAGGSSGGASFLRDEKPTSSQVFDGATMVLLELSFITLWVGIVMGAIWADHSWGRPWGWDPKEVFALNTFLIILALIHIRQKVRDKALWTAVLAVLGFEVMMFNWIVINFIISGLHSYA